MHQIAHRDRLKLLSEPVGQVVERMFESGELSVPALQRCERATRDTNRVITRPNETVYETVREKVEVFYFG